MKHTALLAGALCGGGFESTLEALRTEFQFLALTLGLSFAAVACGGPAKEGPAQSKQAAPARSIERIEVVARTNGDFAVDVFLQGVTDMGAGLAVEAQITSADGAAAAPRIAAQASGTRVTLRTRVESPRRWDAGTRTPYNVEVRLKHGTRLLDSVSQRFGFISPEKEPGAESSAQ